MAEIDLRLEDSSGDRIGSEQRLARESGRRDTAVDPVQYNEVYGTTLTNAQATAYDEFNSKFSAEVEKANKTLSEQRVNADTLYNKDKTTLETFLAEKPLDIDTWKVTNGNLGDAAYRSYLSGTDEYKNWESEWMDENTITAKLITTNKNRAGVVTYRTQGTYKIPKDSANTLKDALKTINRNDTYGVIDSSGNLTIHSASIVDLVSGINNVLVDITKNLSSGLLDAYSKSIYEVRANANTQLTKLNSDYSNAIGNINLEQQKVQNLTNENTQYFTDLRAKYSEKLARIKGTLNG